MIITSKYNSVCTVCNASINQGDRCDWQRGQRATHVACAAQAARPATVPVAQAMIVAERVAALSAEVDRLTKENDMLRLTNELLRAGCERATIALHEMGSKLATKTASMKATATPDQCDDIGDAPF